MLLICRSGTGARCKRVVSRARRCGGKYLTDTTTHYLAELDANDMLYQIGASRNYDPSAKLETIKAPVMWVNSADDFIEIHRNSTLPAQYAPLLKRLPHICFVLPERSGIKTHGHGTHHLGRSAVNYLAELLERVRARTRLQVSMQVAPEMQ